MIGNAFLKICGITRLEDAQRAANLGADFLGFILYSKSPRYLPPEAYRALSINLPAGPKRVAVLVEPGADELQAIRALGFERFQIHARPEVGLEIVASWSAIVGPGALWLAPKLPPGIEFPGAWLDYANSFLVDTYHPEGFGGSGRTGDWTGFAHLAAAHPDKTWILAGGLTPENIRAARAQSGAHFVDVNSGVETRPGVKAPLKLDALVAALRD